MCCCTTTIPHCHPHRMDAAADHHAVDHHAVDQHAVDHHAAPPSTRKACADPAEPIIPPLPPRNSSTGIKRRNPGPVAPADSHLLEAHSLEAEVEAEGMLAVMRQGLQYLGAREHRCVGWDATRLAAGCGDVVMW